MIRKQNVLFVCVHNSARSQMAEALCNQLCGDVYAAKSAGLSPGTLNPLAVEVMREIGLDISENQTRSAFDMVKEGTWFTHVIAVCDGANAERCPIFPGVTERLHWNFADPSQFEGTHEEKLAQTRVVRDEIGAALKEWCPQC